MSIEITWYFFYLALLVLHPSFKEHISRNYISVPFMEEYFALEHKEKYAKNFSTWWHIFSYLWSITYRSSTRLVNTHQYEASTYFRSKRYGSKSRERFATTCQINLFRSTSSSSKYYQRRTSRCHYHMDYQELDLREHFSIECECILTFTLAHLYSRFIVHQIQHEQRTYFYGGRWCNYSCREFWPFVYLIYESFEWV